jgi:uncharacterized OB-fold protein
MSKLDKYVNIENNGTVVTFTMCAEDAESKELNHPVCVALARFPNVQCGLIHKTECNVIIGDKVRPLFEERSKRTGSILGIEYFEKVG